MAYAGDLKYSSGTRNPCRKHTFLKWLVNSSCSCVFVNLPPYRVIRSCKYKCENHCPENPMRGYSLSRPTF
jgi:hypothetical protein